MNVLVVQTEQEIGVTAVIEDADTGLNFDPVTVQFIVIEPDGTTAVVAPANPAIGMYTLLYNLSIRGTYGIQVQTDQPKISAGVNVTAGYRSAWVP